jgi:hypothetical protein
MAVSNGENDAARLESTARRLPVSLSWFALIIGVGFLGFGFAFLLGALIEKNVSLLVAVVVMAILGVLLIRFGLRPWREKKKQLESGLPEGLSRRERNQAIRDIQRQETRDRSIKRYTIRHAELIDRLEEAGHQPRIHAFWSRVEGHGNRLDVILVCERCGLRRQGFRRSRRLSPDRTCTPVP